MLGFPTTVSVTYQSFSLQRKQEKKKDTYLVELKNYDYKLLNFLKLLKSYNNGQRIIFDQFNIDCLKRYMKIWGEDIRRSILASVVERTNKRISSNDEAKKVDAISNHYLCRNLIEEAVTLEKSSDPAKFKKQICS